MNNENIVKENYEKALKIMKKNPESYIKYLEEKVAYLESRLYDNAK